MSSFSFLSNLLAEEFGAEPEEIRLEATTVDLGLDSLSTVELINEVEKHFDIEIPDDKAEFETLGEAVSIIDEILASRGS